MHLRDDCEPVNEEVQVALQQCDDAYHAVMEHTMDYLAERLEKQREVDA